MYSTDFLTAYAADKLSAAQHYAWVESLRSGHCNGLAAQFSRLAARLQPDLASTTSAPKRRAY